MVTTKTLKSYMYYHKRHKYEIVTDNTLDGTLFIFTQLHVNIIYANQQIKINL